MDIKGISNSRGISTVSLTQSPAAEADAKNTSGSQSQALKDLADKFSQAAQTGQMPELSSIRTYERRHLHGRAPRLMRQLVQGRAACRIPHRCVGHLPL